MENKELILRMNPDAIAILEQEIRKKREAGAANSLTDTFVIRLLEAARSNSKVFIFKSENNKLTVKHYASLTPPI